MPASLGITLFSRQILELIFKGQGEAIDISAPLLAMLGSSVLFSCLITTTNSILQSYRHVCLPIISMLLGVIVKVVSSYFLLGYEELGIMGAPIGSLLCNFTAVLLNLCFMKKYTNASLSSSLLLFRPLAASCVSVFGSYVLFLYISRYFSSVAVAFAISLLFAAISYLALAFMLGCLSKNDILLFSFGEKFIKFIEFKKIKDRDP
jgi:stage V sporulation protein B